MYARTHSTNSRLLTRAHTDIWSIRPERFESLLQTVHGQQGQPIIGPTIFGQPVVPQMEAGNGVAVIPVHGVIGQNWDIFDLYFFGCCDLIYLREMLQQASNDDRVSTVVLDIRSPGGVMVGLPEAGAQIRNMKKPTFAMFDDECCSAAYYLAASCNAIVGTASGIVGSIGVFMAGFDSQAHYEQRGFRLELFRSGELKGIGLPGKQWTDQERAYMRGQLDVAWQDFRSVVHSTRPELADEEMQGQWLFGAQAAERRMIDRVIGSREEFLSTLMA